MQVSLTPNSPLTTRSLPRRLINHFEHSWSYLGKMALLSRHLLNISIKTCHRFTLSCHGLSEKVTRIITRIKLLSIVGVPFSLVSLQSTAQKIIKSTQL